MEKLIEIVEKSIKMAENGQSKLDDDILTIEGMSSNKIRHFLNNIINLMGENCKYLEVGSWKGSTFISAMYKNKNAYGISVENFSEFNSNNTVKSTLLKNINRFLDKNWELKDIDFINIGELDNKIDVYLYDAHHDEISQYNAFKIMNNNLSNVFIGMIDDWNWESVSGGTNRIFEELNYTIIKEWTLSSKCVNDKEEWWNGFYVAIIEKKNNEK